MATITTLKSGDYTDSTVWSTGTVPVDGDKVTISKLGTATARVTSSAIGAGSGNVPVTAGTGTGLIGEVIEFDSRPGEYYELTTGFTASAGTAVVTPALAGAIASGETLRNRGHKVKLLGTRVAGDDTAAGFTVSGVLYWDRAANSSLQVKGTYTVSATGTEDRGTEIAPLAAVNAALLLNYSAVMAIGKYGATYAAGARCKHYGKTRTRKTTTTGALSSGTTSFTVVDATGWADGDSLLVFPTATGAAVTVLEERTIATGGVSGNTITITAGLANSKLTGAYVANLTSNVLTDDQSASFGSSGITYSAGASGRLYDKDLVNSQLTNRVPDFRVTFTASAASAAGQPSQWRARGCTFIGYSTFHTLSKGGAGTGPSELYSSVVYNGNASSNTAYALFVQGVKIDQCVIASRRARAGEWGINSNNPTRAGDVTSSLFYSWNAGSQVVGLRSTVGKFNDNTVMAGASTAVGGQGGITLVAPGIIAVGTDTAPFGMTTNIASFSWSDQNGSTTLRNTIFGTAMAPTYGATPGSRVTSLFGSYYGGASGKHEIWDNEGYAYADTSTRNRGDAALNVGNRTTSPFTYSFSQAIANGATKRVVGYLRRNATYAAGLMPSVTLSIPGVTSVVSSVSDTADTWLQVDLSITNTTGSTQEVTVTMSANGAANASSSAWFDGIPIYPFVQAVRHYGFTPDESNPFRTVDSYTVLTESAALALSGVSVNHTTDTITVTAARTIGEIYDYCCANWVANIASTSGQTRHISSDGVSFTTTYSVVVSGGGSISGKYTDASGAVVSATVVGIVPGSRILIVRTDTNAVLSNTIVAGTTHSVSLATAVAVPVSVVVRKASAPVYYQEWSTAGTITPASGFAATANQQPD
jgi:hypothetical protein